MRRQNALTVLTIGLTLFGCTSDVAVSGSTTTTDIVGTTEATLPPLPIDDVPSKFNEGDLVSIFGWSLDEQPTLWGLPTRDGPQSGGSGLFDRQATDLVASGKASSFDGDPPWEHLEFGDLDEFGNAEFGGFVPSVNVGFIGAAEDVTSEVAGMTNERVDDLALAVAQTFAASAGLEVVQITQREFGGRELSYDLVGGIDEVTAGWRIHIEMSDGEPFGVVRVQRTLLCWFAVDESGSCAERSPVS